MELTSIENLENQELENYIPLIGKHLDTWKDVKNKDDAEIKRLEGLSNIT